MINYNLKAVKAIVFDVDGVLSCATIAMDSEGDPIRTINIKDGYAIQLAVKMGIKLVIMTGGHNENIRRRYQYLGVEDVFLKCSQKTETWHKYLAENHLQPEEVVYMGDDIPDLQVMKLAGCPCCPKDAASEIKAVAKYVSDYTGGNGCARDIIEQVLRAKGLWLSDDKAFGW